MYFSVSNQKEESINIKGLKILEILVLLNLYGKFTVIYMYFYKFYDK